MSAPGSGGAPQAPAGICVIMAGGRGTRFWPLSRADRPKQLLPLVTGRSLLRETFERVRPLTGDDRVLVVTSGSLAEATRRELPELPADHVITEPVGRNTAPCAVLGAGLAARIDPGAPVALLPADHHIPDADVYRAQLAEAFVLAAGRETVVTLGIPPTRPDTGYGYLETEAGSGDAPRAGLAFVEKPDRATAERYLAGGRHFWNSGMFVWNAAWFDAMARRHVPEIRRRMEPAVKSFGTPDFAAALQTAYADCPAESIDYAVMEKLPGFTVLPARFGWSDVGGWNAWGELAGPLAGGNLGRGDVLALGSRGNVVRGDGRLIALVGVEDLVVVDTPDALLVCRREDAERLRDVIARLEEEDRRDLL